MRYLLIILLLTSCTSSWHLKQAKKHLLKAEQKGATVRVDTVFKDVITERSITDTVTVLKYNFLTDTITVETVRWKSKLKLDTVHHTLFQQVECKPDTIRVPVQIITTIKAKSIPWWWLIIAGLIGIGMTAVLFILKRP